MRIIGYLQLRIVIAKSRSFIERGAFSIGRSKNNLKPSDFKVLVWQNSAGNSQPSAEVLECAAMASQKYQTARSSHFLNRQHVRVHESKLKMSQGMAEFIKRFAKPPWCHENMDDENFTPWAL